jgi:hypothetical protein
MRVIAAMHVVAAIGLVVAIVALWNPGDLAEALPWILLTILPLAMAWGLWNRRAWAREAVSDYYSPIFFVALAPFSFCLFFYFLVPARGIAVAHVYAVLGLFFLTPILLITGLTVWYLKWTTK